jgi:hypothetical protein
MPFLASCRGSDSPYVTSIERIARSNPSWCHSSRPRYGALLLFASAAGNVENNTPTSIFYPVNRLHSRRLRPLSTSLASMSQDVLAMDDRLLET